jgi:AcrR family transcriptional regulator
MGQRFSSFKLPPGRHGLSWQHVSDNQRWRLVGAAAELLAEDGYLNLSAHKVAHRAAVSPQTFYVHFDNLDDCLLGAFEAGVRRLEGGTLAEAFALTACEPELARLLSLEARAAVPAIAAAYARLVDSRAADLRSRILLEAALALLSEPSVMAPRSRPELADQLTTLISIGCAPWTSP